MPARPAGPPYGERTLRLHPAHTGRDVWELQIKLIAWGSGSNPDGVGAPLHPVRVNGTFDVATRDAVKRFQQAVALPLTGIADAATFRAIDREAALFPVLLEPMRCGCARGQNSGPIACRCNDHPNAGTVCTGFGRALFADQFLLAGKKLPDGTKLDGEKLDVYDMQEYPGIDKALPWAVRGLMRRANIDRIKVLTGYRCWEANYHLPSGSRWAHNRNTFHLGKAVTFYHDGSCPTLAGDDTVPPCVRCDAIRTAALNLCGFQAGWQEPDRVSVAGNQHTSPLPRNPFAVTVSTVKRRDREDDEFISTFGDSIAPLYKDKLPSVAFPLRLVPEDAQGPLAGNAQKQFLNSERGPGGQFPVGRSRLWHGGVHMFAPAGTDIHAIADGEVVACRAGEADNLHPFGSRNFVILRHRWKDTVWYSLYMHLDAEAISAAAAVAWRKKAHLLTVDHVEMDAPCPLFTKQVPALPAKPFLRAEHNVGLTTGDWSQLAVGAAAEDPRAGGAAAPDALAPQQSQIIEVGNPAQHFVYLKMNNVVIGRSVPADATVTNAIGAHTPFGLPSPIKVSAGDVIGKVAAAPTDAALAAHGTFFHLEVFSETQLLTGEGYTAIDAPSENGATSRQGVATKLRDAGFLTGAPADVLLESDVTAQLSTHQLALRAVQLKIPSAWKMDWKTSLTASASRWQLPNATRDTAGDNMNLYRCWDDAKAPGNHLPASHIVWHAHPITWLMHMAAELEGNG